MTGTVTDVDTPTVALRLSNFVLSQREIDAYDILFAKASRVAHGEYDPESDEALAAQFNPAEPLHVANWMGAANASNPAPAYPSLFGSTAHNPLVPVSVSFATP